MSSERYKETLKSERWRRLKWRRIIHAGFKCEEPGCERTLASKRPRDAMKFFHLHHENYDRVGDERLEDVRALCPACHLKPSKHPWRAAGE